MLPLLQNAPRGAFCNTFDLIKIFFLFLSGRYTQVLLYMYMYLVTENKQFNVYCKTFIFGEYFSICAID